MFMAALGSEIMSDNKNFMAECRSGRSPFDLLLKTVTEPGAVATGSQIQPAIEISLAERPIDKVEWLDPVATAPGSVTTLCTSALSVCQW